MPPYDKLPPSECNAFRDAVGDVRPLRQSHAEPHLSRPHAMPRFSFEAEQRVLRDALHDPLDTEAVEPDEALLFGRPGVPPNTLRKLRRGRFIIESDLDLHGFTARQARLEIVRFLDQACVQGERCVRIIHGKGNRSAHHGPVLKNKVNAWLRQWDEVLAFASAHPKDGGAGAVYVLLRRR